MFDRLIELVDFGALLNSTLAYLPNLIAAVAILGAAWLTMRLTRGPLLHALERADFAPGLRDLLVNNVYSIAIMAVAAVMAADQVGINVTAALAGMGIVGLAAGFAAQDSLANSISGFLIFWDKPFQVGDFVEIQDEHYGEVREITLRTTRIRTRNNTYVVIPNKEIIDNALVNHSMYGETRVDIPIGIAYKEDIREARKALLEALAEVEGVLDDPEPQVVVVGLGDSSINLEARVWICEADTERPVYFRTVEACKNALDDAGIEIPFPHLQLFVDDIKRDVFKHASEAFELEVAE